MTESGEREIAESSAFVEYMRKRLGVHDLSSYLDSAAYESDRAMWQAAFEAGRGQELERCAKQLCEYCRDGVPFVDVDPAMAVNRGSFWHRNPIDPMVMSKCGAEAIRALPAPPDSGDKEGIPNEL